MRNGKILCRLHLEICRSRNAIALSLYRSSHLPEYSASRDLARRAAFLFPLPLADPRSRIGANLCGQIGQGSGLRRTELSALRRSIPMPLLSSPRARLGAGSRLPHGPHPVPSPASPGQDAAPPPATNPNLRTGPEPDHPPDRRLQPAEGVPPPAFASGAVCYRYRACRSRPG